jgi:formate C-acetyltransferase
MLQIGTANAGNSLAALEQIIFNKKKLNNRQIIDALKTDFEDSNTDPSGEEIRKILSNVSKYGNDDDYPDHLVKEIFEYTAGEITRYRVWTTGARCTTEEGHVTAHIALGRCCGATPDGRKAGMPVSEGLSPAQGTDLLGPTATLKSVAKLNHILCAGGTLLNQKFNPDIFQDIGRLKKLASLLKTYFFLGGMHVQCNVVSAATLREAQAHPENYPNLLVRVAGYSALFTTLERAIQDEIISRTEQGFGHGQTA